MATVKEAVETVPYRDPIANYKMPEVHVSDTVRWFNDINNTEEYNAARVLKVGHRSIELIVDHSDGRVYRKFDVHHIGDPVIQGNIHLRENGGWDYSSQTLDFLELKHRVQMIEDVLTAETKK